MFENGSIPLQVWELLFNSRLHGGSFNTFMGKAAGRGEQVLCCAGRTWRVQFGMMSGFCLNEANFMDCAEKQ